MTDMPARTIQRRSDSTAIDTGTTDPLPTPQYAGLFIEPDLPPLADEPE
ncbi:hypothetical protein ACIRJR_35280 [Streptomyces sp. NPDC102402]